MRQIAVAVAALMAATSGASATMALSETASPAAKIAQGHGNPGESASSSSDPDVGFRVLESGKIERTNSRNGSVSIIDPQADARRKNRSR